jgi:peptide/nickel transport system substrate-binding protein
MIRKKSLLFIGVILLAVIVLAACGPSAGGGGKVYQVGIFEEPTSTNFWQANGPDNTTWNAYVLLPMRIGMYTLSDQRNQLILSAAADWASPITQEGDKWYQTVPLKKGIKWSDGTEFTAKDVAFTINNILKFGLISGNWQQWVDYNYVESAEAVDDYTVKIIYHTKPGIARTDWGVLQVPILSAAFWEPKVAEAAASLEGVTRPAADAPQADQDAFIAKVGDAQKALFAIDPNGEPLAGSFLFSKWEKGAYLESTANTKFYFTGASIIEYANGAYHESKANTYDFQAYGDATGDKSLDYKTGPFVQSVQYTLYTDQNAALLALQNGEVDYVLNPLGLQKGLAEQVENDPNLDVIQNPSLGFRYLSFNLRREPMGDVAFRQAFATLIDKEFVTKSILQGVAYPLNSWVPASNTAWYFDKVPMWGYNDDGTGMSREERLNKAIEILSAAGYTWQGGVKPTWDADNLQVVPGGALIMPNGKPVPELELMAPSPSYDPMRSTFAIWIETWCNEIGIPVKAKLTGFNVIVDEVFSKQDFDIYILGYSLSIFPSYLRDFFHSDQAVLDGNNAGGYINKDFDDLSDQLLTCESYEACREIADQIQVMVSTDVPWMTLFDTGIYESFSKNLTYPYTEVIGGLQQSVYGMPWGVKVK